MNNFRMIALTVVLATSLMFGGTAYAQEEELGAPGLTPDSPFYFLDTWGKQISLMFTSGSEAKADKAHQSHRQTNVRTQKKQHQHHAEADSPDSKRANLRHFWVLPA